VAYQKNVASNNYIVDVDCFDVYGALADSTAPSMPTGVAAADASTVSAAAARVSWTANTATDLSSYKIYRSTTSGGTYTLVGHVAAPTTSFTDTEVQYGTAYYYTVSAIDTAANESAKSSPVSVTPVEHVPPTAPTVSVTGHGDGLVSLAWSGATDNVGVTGYDVWMKQAVNGAWTKQADVTAESYTRSGLINGMTYYFKVRARDAAGNYSVDSNAASDAPVRLLGDVSMRIEDADPVISYQGTWLTWGPDPAYTNLTARYATIKDSRATLTFTGTGVSVKAVGTQRENRGIANVYIDGVFVTAVDMYSATAGQQATIYEASGLASGTHSLTLEVSGLKNAASNGTVLDVDCFDIAGHVTDLGSLSAPQSLSVQDRAADAGDALALSWNAGAGAGATGYSIYRSLSAAGPFAIVAQVPAGTTTAVDTGLTDGTTYYYRVTAFNAFGIESLPSSTVSRAPVYDLAPAVPSGLSAADVLGDSGGVVALAWNANGESDVTGYRVYRSATSGGAYSQIAQVTGTSYQDSGLTNDTTYFYKLAAVNSHGNLSGQTAAVSAAPRDNSQAPAVPSGLSASDRLDDTGGAISASWTGLSVPDLAGYRLYRADAVEGPYTMVYQGTATSFINTGLTNSVDYFYAIAAYDTDGNESARSTSVSAQARWDRGPSAPTGLLALGGDAYAGVAWLAATDQLPVTGYEVWMKQGSSGTYEKLADNTTTAFTKVGLTNETTYYFKVRGVNSLGNLGAFSNECAAVPHATTGTPHTTRIEDTDSSIVWSGTWLNWGPDPLYSGGTSKYTNYADSRATLTFNGTGISVKAIGAQTGNRGMVDVYIDNVFQTTVDMFSATPTYQTTIYAAQGLSDGQHTLTLRVTGNHSVGSNGSIIDIDCFDVVQP
jgi:large repetitive protein